MSFPSSFVIPGEKTICGLNSSQLNITGEGLEGNTIFVQPSDTSLFLTEGRDDIEVPSYYPVLVRNFAVELVEVFYEAELLFHLLQSINIGEKSPMIGASDFELA